MYNIDFGITRLEMEAKGSRGRRPQSIFRDYL